MDIVDQFLPVSHRDWENVANAHSLQYPLHQRTAESCRRKFQGLANTKPKTSETRTHPSVVKAKAIREKIAGSNGSNNAEDDDIIGEFFEEEQQHGQADAYYELQDIEREAVLPEPTPTFVRLSSNLSNATERSDMARQFDIVSQGSAARELNPPQVPAPLSRGQFEVSRRGTRMNAQQAQVDLFGNWASMRQQMMDDERTFRREEALRRERREEEEQRRREERMDLEMRRREEERQEAAERRRDMMAMVQAALGVFVNAANQGNGQEGNQSNQG